jgi:hypothetical protein
MLFGIKLIPYPAPIPIENPAFFSFFWFSLSLTKLIFSIFVNSIPG